MTSKISTDYSASLHQTPELHAPLTYPHTRFTHLPESVPCPSSSSSRLRSFSNFFISLLNRIWNCVKVFFSFGEAKTSQTENSVAAEKAKDFKILTNPGNPQLYLSLDFHLHFLKKTIQSR